MESKLARQAQQDLNAAVRRLGAELRLIAFLAHDRPIAALAEAACRSGLQRPGKLLRS